MRERVKFLLQKSVRRTVNTSKVEKDRNWATDNMKHDVTRPTVAWCPPTNQSCKTQSNHKRCHCYKFYCKYQNCYCNSPTSTLKPLIVMQIPSLYCKPPNFYKSLLCVHTRGNIYQGHSFSVQGVVQSLANTCKTYTCRYMKSRRLGTYLLMLTEMGCLGTMG